MNIKKKFLLILTTSILVLGLTSCNFSSFRSDFFSRDDYKIADTRLNQIIKALEKKDKNGLKKLFSPNALKKAKDIDAGIDYLMSFYKGKLLKKDDGTHEGSDSNDYGVRTSELKCMYEVTTDADKYLVFFIDQIEDTGRPDKVGLYMLQIIKQSDREKYFDWGGKSSRCAGIWRPSKQ